MKLVDRAKARLRRARETSPWLDHLVRAGVRYKGDGGDRLAASLTFYLFLSLFPLLLLGVSVLGFALNGYEQLQERVFTTLVDAVPGLASTFEQNLEAIKENAGKTGVVALGGVLFAGLGGITALRDSLRLMWHQSPGGENFVKGKLNAVVTLVGLGLTLLASFAVSTVASSLLDAVLSALGIASTPAAMVIGRVFALAVAMAADVLLFLYMFRRLPKVDWPFRQVLRGAVFAAVGFGALKFVATFYVARAATNSSQLYGSVGAVIGILVGLNLISRFVLFAASWTVTAPGCDDVLPSATASPAAAAAAGGAATPDGTLPDARREDEPSPPRLRSAAAVAAAAERQVGPSAAGRVQVAAGATLGAVGTAAALVVVKGLRTLWGSVRSS